MKKKGLSLRLIVMILISTSGERFTISDFTPGTCKYFDLMNLTDDTVCKVPLHSDVLRKIGDFFNLPKGRLYQKSPIVVRFNSISERKVIRAKSDWCTLSNYSERRMNRPIVHIFRSMKFVVEQRSDMELLPLDEHIPFIRTTDTEIIRSTLGNWYDWSVMDFELLNLCMYASCYLGIESMKFVLSLRVACFLTCWRVEDYFRIFPLCFTLTERELSKMWRDEPIPDMMKMDVSTPLPSTGVFTRVYHYIYSDVFLCTLPTYENFFHSVKNHFTPLMCRRTDDAPPDWIYEHAIIFHYKRPQFNFLDGCDFVYTLYEFPHRMWLSHLNLSEDEIKEGMQERRKFYERVYNGNNVEKHRMRGKSVFRVSNDRIKDFYINGREVD